MLVSVSQSADCYGSRVMASLGAVGCVSSGYGLVGQSRCVKFRIGALCRGLERSGSYVLASCDVVSQVLAVLVEAVEASPVREWCGQTRPGSHGNDNLKKGETNCQLM